MKLIAVTNVFAAAGLVKPGQGFTADTDEAGQGLKTRGFARDPSESELAQFWPAAEAPAPAPEPDAEAPAPATEPAAAPAPRKRK